MDLVLSAPSRGDTIVGHDVWLGYQALVLPGVSIGHGALAAAASVVSADVPPYAIVAGNPARVVRRRYGDADVQLLLRAAWWDWPIEAVTEHAPDDHERHADRARTHRRHAGVVVTVTAIRPEAPEDHGAVRRVLEHAFGRESDEPALVEALRAAGAHVPELCLVALAGDEVVGHVLFSRAWLDSGDDVLALAPMAVLPEWQRHGVGTRLVEESLKCAEKTDFPLVVVLGHPEYYPRFGFERAGAYGVTAPWDVPAEAWMVRRLPAYRPEARGLVTYPPAFDTVT